MGSLSFHVIGRGCAEALCSSAHGAGRIKSRTEARKTITSLDLQRQMGKVWYDFHQSDRLRDERGSPPPRKQTLASRLRLGASIIQLSANSAQP